MQTLYWPKSKFLLFILSVCSTFFFSCKKELNYHRVDKTEIENFLKLPSNSPEELQIITSALNKQIEEKNFVQDFLNWHGQPQWQTVIKLKDVQNGIGTFLIPIKKDSNINSFFAATIEKDGNVLFELHRKNSIQNGLREYSYNGLSEKKVKVLFNYFNQRFSDKQNTALSPSLASPPYCWWVMVNHCANSVIISTSNGGGSCIEWVEHCVNVDDDGGDCQGCGGGGGGGGGCTTDCNPPPCYSSVWYYNVVPGDCNTNGIPNSAVVAFLANNLGLNSERINWLNSHPNEALEIKELIIANRIITFVDGDPVISDDPNALIASKITIDAAINNLISGPYNATHYNLIKQYIPNSNNHPNIDPNWWAMVTINAIFIKLEHPDWSNIKILWEATRESVLMGLDVIGLFPIFGEVADLASGVIYTIEGDGLNATLSFSSTIPALGWGPAVGRIAKRLFTASDGTKRTLKWIVNANNIIHFGDRGLLRKVLALAPGDARIAHHIIPWEHGVDDLIQEAAKGTNAFNLNEILNGIPLSSLQHGGNHNLYNDRVKAYLVATKNSLVSSGQFNPQTARNALENLINNVIKPAILNNPNLPLNQIVF